MHYYLLRGVVYGNNAVRNLAKNLGLEFDLSRWLCLIQKPGLFLGLLLMTLDIKCFQVTSR